MLCIEQQKEWPLSEKNEQAIAQWTRNWKQIFLFNEKIVQTWIVQGARNWKQIFLFNVEMN